MIWEFLFSKEFSFDLIINSNLGTHCALQKMMVLVNNDCDDNPPKEWIKFDRMIVSNSKIVLNHLSTIKLVA